MNRISCGLRPPKLTISGPFLSVQPEALPAMSNALFTRMLKQLQEKCTVKQPVPALSRRTIFPPLTGRKAEGQIRGLGAMSTLLQSDANFGFATSEAGKPVGCYNTGHIRAKFRRIHRAGKRSRRREFHMKAILKVPCRNALAVLAASVALASFSAPFLHRLSLRKMPLQALKRPLPQRRQRLRKRTIRPRFWRPSTAGTSRLVRSIRLLAISTRSSLASRSSSVALQPLQP